MNSKANSGGNNHNWGHKNTYESLTDLGSSIAYETTDSMKKIGTGIVDSFLGSYDWESEKSSHTAEKKEPVKAPARRIEQNVFSFRERAEQQAIRELTEQVKAQTERLDKMTTQLSDKMTAVKQEIINANPEQTGVYRIRFLEQILSWLSEMMKSVGSANTWMEAMMNRKQKRGSAFAARSKQKGTQYSLSQELSTARSVQ